MKKYRAQNFEVVLYSYLFGMGYIFVVLLFTGQLPSAMKVSQEVRSSIGQFILHFVPTNTSRKDNFV